MWSSSESQSESEISMIFPGACLEAWLVEVDGREGIEGLLTVRSCETRRPGQETEGQSSAHRIVKN